jgi:hypothetical protein
LTKDSLSSLDTLTDAQIQLEVKYLKLTIAPELKLRHRVKDNQNPGKYKLPLIPVEQMKINIMNIINPGMTAPIASLDILLSNITL